MPPQKRTPPASLPLNNSDETLPGIPWETSTHPATSYDPYGLFTTRCTFTIQCKAYKIDPKTGCPMVTLHTVIATFISHTLHWLHPAEAHGVLMG